MLRNAVLSSVLLISAFAHSASLSSSAFHGIYEPGRDGALAYALAQTPAPGLSGFDSNYKLSLPKPVQDKNFYLLSLFQRDPSVRRLLSQNKTLKLLATATALAL
jgi:hypothetical protein